MLGIGVAAGGLLPISESVAFNKKLYKVTKTRLGMGTYVSITVMHPSRIQGEEVIGMAFETMDRLTGFSGEEVSQLGALLDGVLRAVEFREVLALTREKANLLRRVSEAAGDLTIRARYVAPIRIGEIAIQPSME